MITYYWAQRELAHFFYSLRSFWGSICRMKQCVMELPILRKSMHRFCVGLHIYSLSNKVPSLQRYYATLCISNITC